MPISSSSLLVLLTIALIAITTPYAAASKKSDWSGTWRGIRIFYPEDVGPKDLEVTLELGSFPTVDNNYTLRLSTHRQEGKVQAIHNYHLCRRNNDEDVFTDERNGIIRDTHWTGGELITPYKVDNMLFMATTRIRGDILEDEIVIVDFNDTEQWVQPLRMRAVYRTEMKRVKT